MSAFGLSFAKKVSPRLNSPRGLSGKPRQLRTIGLGERCIFLESASERIGHRSGP